MWSFNKLLEEGKQQTSLIFPRLNSFKAKGREKENLKIKKATHLKIIISGVQSIIFIIVMYAKEKETITDLKFDDKRAKAKN